MDGGRLVKLLFLLSVFLVEMVLGAPKCSGRWAIHSCGGGNGKRFEIDFPGDVEGGSRDVAVLPEFESPELELIEGKTRFDEAYGSRGDEEDLSSYRGRVTNSRADLDYNDRRNRLLQVLIQRLLREKMASDYEE